jgi:hypothetical protein
MSWLTWCGTREAEQEGGSHVANAPNFTLDVLTRSGGIFLSIAVAAAFVTYWLAFTGSDAILKWIRKKLKQRKNQNIKKLSMWISQAALSGKLTPSATGSIPILREQ